MATEKLTKHRVAQIAITLFLLLTAFFWKTVTYKKVNTITCKLRPSCSIFVNKETITVKKNNLISGEYLLYPIPKDWQLRYEGTINMKEDVVTLTPASNVYQTKLIINSSIEILIVE